MKKMKEEKKKNVGGIFESIFDIGYLCFDLIAAILFFTKGKGQSLFLLYGFLTLLLGGGDAFHLVPRVRRRLKGEEARTEFYLGLGLLISSLTMTVFYFLLLGIYEQLYGEVSFLSRAVIYGCGLVRMVLCLFPQNNWFHYEGSARWSLYRNALFLLLGIWMIGLFARAGDSFGVHMAWSIAVSFGCYLPVTLLAKKHPAVGMLMIPKTIAYIWMISMGLGLLP
jgi:hypothetical protein